MASRDLPFWIPAFAGIQKGDEAGLTKGCREWRMTVWVFPCLDSGLRRSIEGMPDRSPGHVFIAIAHAGWCRHTKV